MMSRHRIGLELRRELRQGHDDPALRRWPVAGGPVWGGPLRPDGRAQAATAPPRRALTCVVCESPVTVEGLCMGCWEVC